MFHFMPNPRPPTLVGRDTAGHVSRFLGNDLRVRMIAANVVAQLLQEPDGLEVLAAAVPVGQPLARLAAIIQVQHGRDRVDAQSVGMKFVEPVQRARAQECAHFVATVIEDVAVPFRVKAEPTVSVLVKVGAVEIDQSMFVARKVRRDPVEDHADAVRVKLVDETLQILRRPVARRRREVTGALIAPGAEEWMLHDGQQFDVREAKFVHVARAASRRAPGR